MEKTSKPGKVYDKCKVYGTRKKLYTQLIYILGSFLWVALVIILGLIPSDSFGWMFVLLPLVVFYIGFYNSDDFTMELEDDMFKANHLSLGIIIAVSLFVWISNDYDGNQRHIVTVLVVAIGFSLLGVIDIWVKKKWFSLAKHIKSIFQTISISLLIYVLYLYYTHKKNPAFS